MRIVAFALMLCSSAMGMSTLSGKVVDGSGEAISGAQVFAEFGMSGPVHMQRVTSTGVFRFEDVAPGAVGVFAVADGYSFGGRSFNVSVADDIAPITVVLTWAGEVSGFVRNARGKPITGALITRVVLLGQKVGIPLSKLSSFGIETPRSDARGRYTIGQLPEGSTIALKAGHAQYAQEGVGGISVGARELDITLQQGVLLRGGVVTRSDRVAVIKALVVIRNMLPPGDTALTQSDGFGRFAIRLKPGTYQYQITAANLMSAGWQNFDISGSAREQQVNFYVGRKGQIRGTVKDAATGSPLPDVRITLRSQGNLAAMSRTGPSGEYQFSSIEGENVIEVASASGYFPPNPRATGVRLAAGQEIELTDIWLAPIPQYRLQVVDDQDAPVVGAVVSLLRPRQFGWHATNAEGWVDLQIGSMPPGDQIVGRVEDRDRPLGALFALTRKDAGGAKVQLLPLAVARGKVVSDRGKVVTGALVGGIFPGESADEMLLLWRVLSGRDGYFRWDALVPGIPQRFIARARTGTVGTSEIFNAALGGEVEVGPVTIAGAQPDTSFLGRRLTWDAGRVLCGALPEEKDSEKGGMLVVYTGEREADRVLDGLKNTREILGADGPGMAVVVDGVYTCRESNIAVLVGRPPTAATTYLLDSAGKVVLETFGLPPLRALQSVN